jgi:signal transduction histidine kinase
MSSEPAALGIFEWHSSDDRGTASAGLRALLGFAGGTLAELLDRLHPEDRSPVGEAFAAAAAGGVLDVEARLATADERFVHWSGEAAGGRVVAVCRDITDRVNADRAARRALHARDEVLAIVSHDLRSPLSIVSMAADAIRDTGGDAWGEELGMIKRAVSRMNRLILDLLDVTRMESGRVTFKMGTVDPAAVAGEAIEAFRQQAERRSLALELTLAPSLPALRADRDRVLQALSNLLDNAIKFTDSGAVRVAVDDEDGAAVRFTVADTGQGIDGAQLPHLFERFWRTEPGRRAGNGLGLAIVKGIADAHGGRVAVESAPGRGAVFTLTLPAAN